MLSAMHMPKHSFHRRHGAAIVGHHHSSPEHHVPTTRHERQQARHCRLFLRLLRAARQRAPRRLGHRIAYAQWLQALHRFNSHPFTRELWGQTWSFAHNGDLKLFDPNPNLYSPHGDTDSERAFCHLLSGLALRFETRPPRHVLFAALETLAGEIAAHGSFNFILSNGEPLFAHCSTELHVAVREYPFSVAQLIDCDLSIDFSKHNHLDDRIAVIATQPLTSSEAWARFAPGELKLFVNGLEAGSAPVRRQEWELEICC